MHYANQWRCINGLEKDTCHCGTCLVWYRERGAEQIKNKHLSANACFVKLKEISSSVPEYKLSEVVISILTIRRKILG